MGWLTRRFVTVFLSFKNLSWYFQGSSGGRGALGGGIGGALKGGLGIGGGIMAGGRNRLQAAFEKYRNRRHGLNIDGSYGGGADLGGGGSGGLDIDGGIAGGGDGSAGGKFGWDGGIGGGGSGMGGGGVMLVWTDIWEEMVMQAFKWIMIMTLEGIDMADRRSVAEDSILMLVMMEVLVVMLVLG